MGTHAPYRHIPILISVIAAILLQLPLFELLRRQSTGTDDRFVPRPKPVVSYVTPLLTNQSPTEPEPVGQVVELPKPEQELPPIDDTKYVSDFDSRVDQEQKPAIHIRKSRPKPRLVEIMKESDIQSDESRSVEPSEIPRSEQTENANLPTVEAQPTDEGEAKADDTPKVPLKTGLLLPPTTREAAVANLQALGGSVGSDDALLDTEEGDSLKLNSRRFSYMDFFNRVRDRVRDQWGPGEVYRQRDPTGRLLGVQDRLTVLQVTLDADGQLRKVVTVKRSGADFLDREARRAFEAAAPFVNPPAGLVEDDGMIRFQFGFLLEFSTNQPQFFWKRM